jgi:Cdc6-like AAA superfamily ATPase
MLKQFLAWFPKLSVYLKYINMSFYEDASLVNFPYGTKSGKIYSSKPENGSGDLSFTRSSEATRTTSTSTIDSVDENVPVLDYSNNECPALLLEPQSVQLVRYTNDFTQWTSDNITVTSNFSTSPDGTSNADKLVATSENATLTGEGCSTEIGKNYLVTFWLKSNTSSSQNASVYVNGNTSDTETFTATTSWQKFSRSFTSTNIKEVGMLLANNTDVSVFEFNLIQTEHEVSTIKNDGTSATITREKDSISDLSLSTIDGDLSSFSLNYKFRDLAQDFNNDETFEIPASFGYTPPFTIKKSRFSGKHYPADFNLRSHANVVSTQTLYVDKDASGANNGTSWTDAYTVISDAIQAVNQNTTIYIKGGYYGYDNSSKSAQIPAYDVEFIAVDGQVHNTADQWEDAGSWSASGDAYVATFPNDTHAVVDYNNLDADGVPYVLEPQSSIADVQNNGGFFWDGSDLYIRTSDDRVPDSDLKIYRSQLTGGQFGGIYMRGGGYTVYCEGITCTGWSGGFRTRDQSGTYLGMNLYLNNCGADKVILPYGDEIMIFNSEFNKIKPTEDCLNYDGNASSSSQNVVEYNVTVNTANPSWSSGDSSAQCSTGHQGVDIIRIGSVYKNAYGQNIADVTGANTLIIDCQSINSQLPSQAGYFIGTGIGGNMWLYNCVSSNDTASVQIGDSNSAVYYYNFTYDGTLENGGGGTLSEIFDSGLSADTSVDTVFEADSAIRIETAIGGGYKVYYTGESEYITESGAHNIVIVNDNGSVSQYNDGTLVGTSTHTFDYSVLKIGTGTGGNAPVALERILFDGTAVSDGAGLSNI